MKWDHAVSWSRGVWVSVSDIGRVGSGWPLGRVGRWVGLANLPAPGVETKRNQRRTQNQPTRYYDQAPAMNWNHAVSRGREVWVSVSDIGRDGQPESKQSPHRPLEVKKICCAVN